MLNLGNGKTELLQTYSNLVQCSDPASSISPSSLISNEAGRPSAYADNHKSYSLTLPRLRVNATKRVFLDTLSIFSGRHTMDFTALCYMWVVRLGDFRSINLL